MKLGIDFGTTNSAIAALDTEGRARMLELTPGQRVQRSVIHCSLAGQVTFGNAAFDAYLEQDLTGRFLRSLKAFLSQDVPATTLGRRRYTFPQLVNAYVAFLVERAEALLDEEVTEVVVGRPVRFHDDPERDAQAESRLRDALTLAGLPHCRLQLEPVAAAHRYEHGLAHEHLVLVGDFGGGTSDFAILRVGPSRVGRADRAEDVLATAGVPQAGDVLDGRFLDTFLMDLFGRGATMTPRYATEPVPWDHPILRDIQRLYYLHLLRDDDLARRLDAVEHRMSDPTVVRRLRRLVFDDLGYPMAWAIEQSKRALSAAPEVVFRFGEFYSPTLDIERTVQLDGFAEGCAPQMQAYRVAIDRVLADAQLTDSDIDDVFLTGGTSQLPFVRGMFAARFGADRLRSEDAFTSVCEGLALS